MQMRMSRMGGFTLIELMIVVAVVAIVAAIAFPSFQSTIRNNRIATTTNQLTAAVALARGEAVRTTRGAGICASANGSSCAVSDDWTSGWLVWSDVNGNGTFDPAVDTPLRYMQGNPAVVVTGPSAAADMRFDARGRLGGATREIVLQPKECGGESLRRTMTVAPTGTLRKTRDKETCA